LYRVKAHQFLTGVSGEDAEPSRLPEWLAPIACTTRVARFATPPSGMVPMNAINLGAQDDFDNGAMPTVRDQCEDRPRGRLARRLSKAVALSDSGRLIVPRETSGSDYRAA
jgi:hypothetical protein